MPQLLISNVYLIFNFIMWSVFIFGYQYLELYVDFDYDDLELQSLYLIVSVLIV